jgi:hypothetical protein
MSIHRIADAVTVTQPVGRLYVACCIYVLRAMLYVACCDAEFCMQHAPNMHAACSLPVSLRQRFVWRSLHSQSVTFGHVQRSAAPFVSFPFVSFLLGAAARCRQRVHSHGSRSQHRRAGQVRIQRCNKCSECNDAPNPTVQPVGLRCSVAVSPARPSPAQPSPAQPSPAQPSPAQRRCVRLTAAGPAPPACTF